MPTTSVLNISERLLKDMGDWLKVSLTTNPTAIKHLASTTLNQYDNGRDDFFEGWWIYIPDFLNTNVERKVRKYYTANATLNVYGANMTADASNLSNVWVTRFPFSDTLEAIRDATKELYPVIHKQVVDKSLATNMDLYEYPLPSSFNDGDVYQVEVNVSIGNTGTPTDQTYVHDQHWNIINEGNTLRLGQLYTSGREIKISGIVPLEDVTSGVSVVNASGQSIELIAAYAKYKLYGQKQQPVTSEDTTRWERAEGKAFAEYKRLLPKARMSMPSTPMRLR